MFTSDTIAMILKQQNKAAALEKAKSAAVFYDLDADAAVSEATRLWSINNPPDVAVPQSEELTAALRSGLTGTLRVLEDGSVVVHWNKVVPAPVAAAGRPSGKKRKYNYFHKGEMVRPLAVYLRKLASDGDPEAMGVVLNMAAMDSAVAKYEATGGAEGSQSKIGAWDALQKWGSDGLKGEFTREIRA